jgi:hypothetical protein
MKSILMGAICFLLATPCLCQSKLTISGYIKDERNGEALIGATVFIKETASGTASNVYGFYSLTLPAGSYSVEYHYLGFVTAIHEVSLTHDTRLDIELSMREQLLKEVVISSKALDEKLRSVEMSTNEIDIKSIEKLPAFAGEVDIIKSIQLLPGVTTVGEGASGFNVRGGTVGQNLVLLDEAPVYQSSHLFGFFSVFNPDAVKDVKLYKGGIPAQYGGRLSSILDIRMKEGNTKTYQVNGGIGTIFSRLAIEGPIEKEKSSFIIAARRSYADVLAKAFTDVLDDGAQLSTTLLRKRISTSMKKTGSTLQVILAVIFLSSIDFRDLTGATEQLPFDGTICLEINYFPTTHCFTVNMTTVFKSEKITWINTIGNQQFVPTILNQSIPGLPMQTMK